MPASSSAPLLVRYRLALGEGESGESRALRLACEQTSELPPDLVPASARPFLGRVESVESVERVRGEPRSAVATIALPAEAAGEDLAQLLVLLFGNASLQPGVRVESVAWPAELLLRFAGPAFGIGEDGTFRGVLRQTLLGKGAGEEALAFLTRIFEIAPGGFSTLERHGHPLDVVVLSGRGHVTLGNETFSLAPHACVYVAPETPHQFRADQGEPLGFHCIVDCNRDRPRPIG